MKKLLKDLTLEELKALLNTNKKFKEIVTDYSFEGADLAINEILDPFRNIRGLNYEISLCRCSYFEVGMGAYTNFLQACEETKKSFCLFSEEQEKELERALKKAKFYQECLDGYVDISASRFDCLNTWLENIVNDLADTIKKECVSIYENYDTEETLIENLELVAETYGKTYETDGKILFETVVRQYE